MMWNKFTEEIKKKIKERNFRYIITLIKSYKNYIDFFFKYEENKKSLLHIAVLSNNLELTEILLKKFKYYASQKKNLNSFQQYINKKTEEGETALYIAVLNYNINIVKLLIEYKADPDIKTRNNESIFDIINNRRKLDEEILEYLNKNSKKDKGQDNKNDLENVEPRGLINIKGSCYLNTVLQCFFHIKDISEYFLENRNNFNGMPISEAYCSVILGLSENKRCNAFEPKEFKLAMQNINPNYDKYGNDPKDAAMDIIYYINQEMLAGEPSIQFNNKLDKCNKEQLFKYYKDEEDRTKTIISESFGWMKQIKKKCIYCPKYTYDFVSDDNFNFNLEKISKNNNSIKTIDLATCFKYYFKYDKKKFTCQNEKCKKINNDAYITNKICYVPKYMFIILDRGKNDHYDCNVDFNYEFDIKNFTEQIGDEKYSTQYILIGATFLLGRSGAGHTVAFCRHFDNEYYLFNDSRYKKENLENLKSDQAFLLFYKRKDD